MDMYEFHKAIAAGELDENFEEIYDAIKSRRKALDNAKIRSFKTGDRVYLDNVRPLYLSGLSGTIIGRSRKGFEVEIDERHDTRRFGRILNVKPGMIEAM